MTGESIKEKVTLAIEILLDNDRYLLTNDINERSISHRLACYLQQQFKGWDVDCEYNKNHHLPKVLDLPNRPQHGPININDTEAKTVYPDIIIHHRYQFHNRNPDLNDNYIVIEIKKNSRSNEFDLMKLRAFKAQLHYKHTIFIRFNCENNNVVAEIMWDPE
jgi:hypothetical protein